MMSEMTYTQVGEVQIPDLKLEHPDTKPLGKYGRMRRAFLQENNTTLLSDLILTEQLFPHLQEIDETSEPQSGTADERVSETEPGTGQSDRPDGMDTAHEQSESTGRGSSEAGAYQQLSFKFLPYRE